MHKWKQIMAGGTAGFFHFGSRSSGCDAFSRYPRDYGRPPLALPVIS